MNSRCTGDTGTSGNVFALALQFRPGKSRRLLYQPVGKFLSKRVYDVVHVHSGSISALAYIAKAARKSGVKKVIVHSHASGVRSMKHRMIRFVYGFVLRKYATDFLACSREAGVMKYSSDLVRNKLVVIQNGIDIDQYRYNITKREEIRRDLGISDEDYILGHVGRISKEKNHEYLIEIFDKVHERIPNSKLLLIGDGELRNEIRFKVKEFGLDSSVIFTGNVDNVQDYYQAMDVFLLPSIYEGLGYAAIEAQAAGLPCVISTGVPETVKVSNHVFRIDLEDKEKWIGKVIALNKVRRSDNSDSLRLAGYDIRDTAAQVRDLYFQDSMSKTSAKKKNDGADNGQMFKAHQPAHTGYQADKRDLNAKKDKNLKVLQITGEPILHGGQEKFIQNLIGNIDHTDLMIDVLTPYDCDNEAFVQTVKNGINYV